MKLAVLGGGGHGKVVADIAECCGWDGVVFFDDAWPHVSRCGVWHVEGGTERLHRDFSAFGGVIVAIGNNRTRLEKTAELLTLGANVVSLVHPAAVVSRYAVLGAGSVVVAGAVVNAFSKTGAAVIVNTSSSIGHDCVIGSGVHIAPGARLAGGSMVGDMSWIGIGSCVKQLVEVGANAMVGAGAVVTRHVPSGATVVGNPARLMNKD